MIARRRSSATRWPGGSVSRVDVELVVVDLALGRRRGRCRRSGARRNCRPFVTSTRLRNVTRNRVALRADEGVGATRRWRSRRSTPAESPGVGGVVALTRTVPLSPAARIRRGRGDRAERNERLGGDLPGNGADWYPSRGDVAEDDAGPGRPARAARTSTLPKLPTPCGRPSAPRSGPSGRSG